MRTIAAMAAVGVLAFVAAPVRAEPMEKTRRMSGGAFVGGNILSDEVELGNAVPDDQVPGSGLLLGVRGGYLLLPAIAPDSALDPRLGVEVEAKFLFASTEGDAAAMRPSSFSPVLGWRAHAILDLWSGRRLAPFVLAGLGGETVFSDSPFMESPDTDAALHFGAGGRYDLADRYGVRADLRLGITAGRFQTAAATFEAHVGAFYRFDVGGGGQPKIEKKVLAEAEPEPPAEPPEPSDTDGDGIPDAEDECPKDAEVFNEIDDDDGCPEADSDNDGLLGSRDQCPAASEDVDGFEDDDGCPDPDNDGDGRPDVVDGCPGRPETMNGFEDEDGCPDEVPPEVQKFTGTIKGIKFRTGSSRILGRSKRTLNEAVQILKEHESVRVEISGHTDSRGSVEINKKLSRERADSVKWYLVDRGIDEERLVTVGHGPEEPIADNRTRRGRAQNRRIEFKLLPGPATIPDPREDSSEGEEPEAASEAPEADESP